MRDAPPSAAEAYANAGLLIAAAGAVMVVCGVFFDLPPTVFPAGAATAFVGWFTIEYTRRLWGR